MFGVSVNTKEVFCLKVGVAEKVSSLKSDFNVYKLTVSMVHFEKGETVFFLTVFLNSRFCLKKNVKSYNLDLVKRKTTHF